VLRTIQLVQLGPPLASRAKSRDPSCVGTGFSRLSSNCEIEPSCSRESGNLGGLSSLPLSRFRARLSGESNSAAHRSPRNRKCRSRRHGVRGKAPLRPSGGRGRGPGATAPGKVRWAAPQTSVTAPLTLPSPPGRRGERGEERVIGSKFRGNSVPRISPDSPAQKRRSRNAGTAAVAVDLRFRGADYNPR
jgi:hypothetical protein